MRLSRAKQIVRRVLKDRYGEDQETDGGLYACNYFLRRTRCQTTSGNVTLSSGTATVDIAATLTDFRFNRWCSGEIAGYPLRARGYEVVQAKRREQLYSGRPKVIAWRTPGTAYMWPTPDSAYTLSVVYTQFIQTSDVYDGTEDDPELNVPEEYILDVLWLGASSAIEVNNPSVLYQNAAWQRFEQFIEDVQGECALTFVHDPQLDDSFDEET